MALGRAWLVVTLGILTLFVVLIAPAIALIQPISNDRERTWVSAAPACPECFSGSVVSPVMVSIGEQQNPWNVVGAKRTATVTVALLASVPRARWLEDPEQFAWRLQSSEADGVVTVTVEGAGIKQDFPVPIPMSAIEQGSSPARVLIAYQKVVRVEDIWTVRSRATWTENWHVAWRANSEELKLPVSPGHRLDEMDFWRGLDDAGVAEMTPTAVPVEVDVCPECTPIEGFGDAEVESLLHLKDATTLGVSDDVDWETPWLPWSWFMPSYVGVVLGVAVPFGVTAIALWARRVDGGKHARASS